MYKILMRQCVQRHILILILLWSGKFIQVITKPKINTPGRFKYVLAFGICLDISNSYGAWQNAGAKVQFHIYAATQKPNARIYIFHPECIVSRCYKVARAAQLMWRVLCAVQLPLRAALFPFPHFHRYMASGILFWSLLRTPVFCFHFQHNNRTLPLLLAKSAVQTAAKAGKIDACTHLHSLAHVAWIADYRNLLLCVAETIAAISSPGREKLTKLEPR